MDQAAPYSNLTPDLILDAVEQAGYQVSGSLLALNSYENRVYQVGLESGEFVVVKIYRPQRWPDAAILEEHRFALELAELEIPLVAPLALADGQTLLHFRDYRLALYPRRGGHAPELDDPDSLRWLGRVLGRLHACGARRAFAHRPTLSVARFGQEPFDFLQAKGFIPTHIEHNYCRIVEELLGIVGEIWANTTPWIETLRLHGDCHPGNILWTREGPHFVDLDDCMNGPAMQDLWMLLSGSRDEMSRQLTLMLEGYEQFYMFNPAELQLLETLRTLRLLHYSAWLARRWEDPAFPLHFPWFNTPRYWEEQLYTLREQAERLEQPPLRI